MTDIPQSTEPHRLFVDKAAVKDFYESNLPPEVEPVFDQLNVHLKEKFGDQFVELIPLGSLRGGWALRKSVGMKPDKFFDDIDCGVIINVNEEERRLRGEMRFSEVINNEVKDFIADNNIKWPLCNFNNPKDVYLNIGDLDYEIKKAMLAIKVYNGAFSIALQELSLPFLSKDKQLRDRFENELRKRYGEDGLAKIKSKVEENLSKAMPKHIHGLVGDGGLTARRVSKLKQAWRSQNEQT